MIVLWDEALERHRDLVYMVLHEDPYQSVRTIVDIVARRRIAPDAGASPRLFRVPTLGESWPRGASPSTDMPTCPFGVIVRRDPVEDAIQEYVAGAQSLDEWTSFLGPEQRDQVIKWAAGAVVGYAEGPLRLPQQRLGAITPNPQFAEKLQDSLDLLRIDRLERWASVLPDGEVEGFVHELGCDIYMAEKHRHWRPAF